MTEDVINVLVERPEFKDIDQTRFPEGLPLRGILKNDCRIRDYQPGDIVLRKGDYGESAFMVLSGTLRVVISPDLPEALFDTCVPSRKKSLLAPLGKWLGRTDETAGKDGDAEARPQAAVVNIFDSPLASDIFTVAPERTIDRPGISDDYQTAILEEGTLFGEISALGKVQRTATVYAEFKSQVLELRREGLRDIRKYDPVWRKNIDETYRRNMLNAMLANSPYFSGLDEKSRERVRAQISLDPLSAYDLELDPLRLVYKKKPIKLPGNFVQFTIGRSKVNDLVATDSHVSREHAKIERQGEHVVLVNLSANGCCVRPKGGEPQVVKESFKLEGRGSIGLAANFGLAGDEVVHYLVS